MALQLSDISHQYGRERILSGIDLHIKLGQIVLLSGPNGAGKTTLLRIAATVLRPSQGQVRIGGLNPEKCRLKVRQSLGVAFSKTYLMADLTIAENLMFYGQLMNLPSPQSLVQQWLNRFRLLSLKDREIRFLSMGERQKVSLIRSLMHQPSLVIWDEPAVGLDASTRQEIINILMEVRKRASVFVASHDVELFKTVADKHWTLQQGRLQG